MFDTELSIVSSTEDNSLQLNEGGEEGLGQWFQWMSDPNNAHAHIKFGAVTDYSYWIFIKAARGELGWQFAITKPLVFSPQDALVALCQLFYDSLALQSENEQTSKMEE